MEAYTTRRRRRWCWSRRWRSYATRRRRMVLEPPAMVLESPAMVLESPPPGAPAELVRPAAARWSLPHLLGEDPGPEPPPAGPR